MPKIVLNFDLWKKGITPSGFIGLENSYLCNMDVPGIIKASNSTVKQSDNSGGDEVTATPLKILRDSANDDLYVVDNTTTPRIYRSTDSGDTWAYLTAAGSGTNSAGKGAAIWKGYFFSFAGQVVDVYGILPTFSLVDADWTVGGSPISSTDAFIHPALHSEDDALYIGHKNILSKVAELTTFDPTSSSTFSVTATALNLPSQERIRTLNDLGGRIITGTWRDTSTPIAKLYLWDRVSSSFDRPLELPEKGIRSSLVVGSLMYFVAGDKGRLYVTDGNSIQLVASLPDELTSNINTVIDVFPYAMTYDNGKVLIAYSFNGAGSYSGLWSWDLKYKRWNIEHTISTLTTNDLSAITAVYPSQGTAGIITGWFDSDLADYGIDQVGTNQYSSHASYIETPMYQVGTKNNPYSFSLMEINLAKNISSNGIRVAYRTVHTGSYTTIDTFSTDGVSSFKKEIGNLLNIEKIQFKISFTGSPSPELMNITIY